jgi:hypothetical protein
VGNVFNSLTSFLPGNMFVFGDYSWIKLEELENNSTLCITNDIICNMAFDTNDNNDWRKSSLRKYLNNEFYSTFRRNNIEPINLLSFTSDLTANNGMKDYGTSTDKFALLSCDQYRRYRDIIPDVNEWYWTLTATTCNPAHRYNVCGITLYETFSSNIAYNNSPGVRPICCLKSDTIVSTQYVHKELAAMLQAVIDADINDEYRVKN